VRYSYTWGMGGINFYLFLVLTFTGVLLMFYYHPSKVQAFRDVLYLEHDVPFGKLLRNMHRWAAHLMVIAVELHMFRVFLTGSYKKAPRVQLERRRDSSGVDATALLHRLSAARRSTRLLGCHRGKPTWPALHRFSATRAPSARKMGMTPYNGRPLWLARRFHR